MPRELIDLPDTRGTAALVSFLSLYGPLACESEPHSPSPLHLLAHIRIMSSTLRLFQRIILGLIILNILSPVLVLGQNPTQEPEPSTTRDDPVTTSQGPSPTEDVCMHFELHLNKF